MSTAQPRDDRWFTDLYTAHYPEVVRYGLRRLGDVEAAAELAQEVFMVAWRRRDRVPPCGLPWLYAVARKLLANQWRGRRSNPTPLPLNDPESLAQAAGGPQPESVVVLADLRAALESLPEIDREILRLVGWEQLNVIEAATVLGCSRVAAAVRLHRARRRLAAAMAPEVKSTPAAVPGLASARRY